MCIICARGMHPALLLCFPLSARLLGNLKGHIQTVVKKTSTRCKIESGVQFWCDSNPERLRSYEQQVRQDMQQRGPIKIKIRFEQRIAYECWSCREPATKATSVRVT